MGKPDMEPLTERQWSRIERDLFARVALGAADPEGPRVQAAPSWRAARAATALVLAGAAAAIGGVFAWRSVAAPVREAMVSPSRITTEATGSHVNVGEATLDVGPQSTVSVSGDDARGTTVVLERGRVECEVPPRRGRPPFAVEAGDVVVRVVGTHFAVTRSPSAVEVGVERGVVQVAQGARRFDVSAGETWPPAPPPAPSPPAAPAAPSESRAAAPSGAAPAGAPAASAASAPSPRDRYAEASGLEVSHPDQAIAIYRDLASRGGPWGMNALFAEARLEADRGQIDDARRLLAEYLARYPSGPNADDARQIEQRLR